MTRRCYGRRNSRDRICIASVPDRPTNHLDERRLRCRERQRRSDRRVIAIDWSSRAMRARQRTQQCKLLFFI